MMAWQWSDETCHYFKSSYSCFIARLGWAINGCAKCTHTNHITQLITWNLPWNFPCYCHTLLLRVFSSRWISTCIKPDHNADVTTSYLCDMSLWFSPTHDGRDITKCIIIKLTSYTHYQIQTGSKPQEVCRVLLFFFTALSITRVILLSNGRTTNT
jgi:hypothetical protein